MLCVFCKAIYLDDQMSGWLVESNTVIDAQMGIMVGGGRDVVVASNSFIGCDKALHIDNRGMGGEKGTCLGPDLTSLTTVMAEPTWAKYGLSDRMSPNATLQCSPVNVSAIGNCFQDNKADWELWCGASPTCMNEPQWLSRSAGNKKGPCRVKFDDQEGTNLQYLTWLDGNVVNASENYDWISLGSSNDWEQINTWARHGVPSLLRGVGDVWQVDPVPHPGL